MLKKNLIQKFKLTVLSPVHIGSGFRKFQDIDFYTEPQLNTTYVIDQNRIFALLANNKSLQQELATLDVTDISIKDLLKRYHINPEQVTKVKYPLAVSTKEFHEFLRTGLGQPLLPGSSLKGAIRTALLKHFFDSYSPAEKQKLLELINLKKTKGADEILLKKIFGSDPNHNLMRTLIPEDAHFQESDLMLFETRVLSLRKENWAWKTSGYQSDTPMRIYCEALRPNSQTILHIACDNFLLTHPEAQKELHLPHSLSPDIDQLITTLNEHARRIINTELQFFRERNNERGELTQLINNYQTIAKHIPSSPTALVIRLGWGSGWESMTGNLLPEFPTTLQNIRRHLGLGKITCPNHHELRQTPKWQNSINAIGYWCKDCKQVYRPEEVHLFPVFPKSRKIAFSNNQPALPLGWIKLEKIT